MAGSGDQMIKCRCDRRHPLGTEWCPCGAYLPHDGTIIDVEASEPAPPPTPVEDAPTAPLPSVDPEPAIPEVPKPAAAAAYDPTEALEAAAVRREEKMIRAGTPAAAYEPDKQQAAMGEDPGFVRVPRPDDQVCPSCHDRNDAGRVFCARCGTQLSTLSDEEYEQNFSWWQKLVARVRGKDLKSSAMNAKYQVRRVKGLSTRARMFRTALLGGAVGAVGIGFVPGLRSEVTGRVKDISLPDRYSFVEVDTVVADPDLLVVGWEPGFIHDLALNRAWGVIWTRGEDAGFDPPDAFTRCLLDYPTIRMNLAEPSDVDRLRVWAGTWADDPTRAQKPRPRLLQVREVAADGVVSDSCVYLPVGDEPDPQSIDLGAEDVSALDVSIVGVHPGDGSNSVVAISELWLENER